MESEESETEHPETEDRFLERYAETARQLQEEAVEEAENGQDEDGHEIELGMNMLSLFSSFVYALHLLNTRCSTLWTASGHCPF